jgi:hypothetical protein
VVLVSPCFPNFPDATSLSQEMRRAEQRSRFIAATPCAGINALGSATPPAGVCRRATTEGPGTRLAEGALICRRVRC